jgi:hypothetical protein
MLFRPFIYVINNMLFRLGPGEENIVESHVLPVITTN